MKPNNEVNGILLINKSKDITSTDSLNIIKKRCNIKSIGHAGTLDPFAMGLLIACAGKTTKMIHYFQGLSKEYEAVFQLGAKTNTYDTEGEVVARSSKTVTQKEIKDVLPEFQGHISQKPPIFSALKVGGERAYNLARKNIEFELEHRNIEILELLILKFNEETQELRLRIACSKGTYIRSLAYDIGERLRCYAYVKELTRTKIGPYHTNNATLDIFMERDQVIPITQFFKGIPELKINSASLKKVLNGATIEPQFILKEQSGNKNQDTYKPSYYSIYSTTGVFIAVVDNQTHKPFYIDPDAIRQLS